MATFAALPIPALSQPRGWQEVEIRECGERLVPLSTLAPDRIVVEARYHQEGYSGAMEECYARESVARLLLEAAKTLPPGWQVVIFDAWRPVALQRQIFDRYKARLRGEHPELTEHALDEETQRYVAWPSANPERPSPHLTGGAVDLSWRDAAGCNLDMGTDFDAFDDKSGTRYFEHQVERHGRLTPEEEVFLRNRRVLFHALAAVGFTNYPEEWWHFDYGRSQYGPVLSLEGWLVPDPGRSRP
jgi:D-alanyl-D-alanine dipeptidase